jgi:hypothetical protein
MLALAAFAASLTSCDGGGTAAPADPDKEVTSATLERELALVADECVAQPEAILSRDAVLKDLHDRTPKALVITAGEEAKLQNGDFNDAANLARLKKVDATSRDFGASLPVLTNHLFSRHNKQPLSGVRLALLVQLAERRVAQIPFEQSKR